MHCSSVKFERINFGHLSFVLNMLHFRSWSRVNRISLFVNNVTSWKYLTQHISWCWRYIISKERIWRQVLPIIDENIKIKTFSGNNQTFMYVLRFYTQMKCYHPSPSAIKSPQKTFFVRVQSIFFDLAVSKCIFLVKIQCFILSSSPNFKKKLIFYRPK